MYRKLVLSLIIASAVVVSFQPAANAQSFDCDSVVVNSDGFIDTSDDGLNAVASDLNREGVSLHVFAVRTADKLPGSQVLREIMDSCPNWGTYPDLEGSRLALIVSLSDQPGQSDVSTFWDPRLDARFSESEAENIRQGIMIPSLRERQVTRAMTEAADAFLSEFDTPSNLGGNSPSSSAGESTSIPWTKILIGVVSVVVAGALIWLFVSAAIRQRRRTAFKHEAESDLSESAVNYFNASSAREPLGQRVLLRSGRLEASELVLLNDMATRCFSSLDTAGQRYQELQGQLSKSRDIEEWEAFGNEVEQFREEAASLPEQCAALSEYLDELDSIETGLPGLVSALEHAIGVAVDEITAVHDEGFMTDSLSDALELVKTGKAGAEEKVTAHALFAAREELNVLVGNAEGVASAACELPKTRASLLASSQALDASIIKANQDLTATSHRLNEMQDEFHSASTLGAVEELRGARDAVQRVDVLAGQVRKQIGMDVQEFAGAQTDLASADEALVRFQGHLSNIHELDKKLINGRDNGLSILKSVRDVVQTSRQFCQQHEAEVPRDSLLQLNSIEAHLEELEEYLKAEKPEYLSLMTQVQEAWDQCVEVNAAAKRMHETFTSLRSRIVSSRKQAVAVINGARIDVGHHDVGSGARYQLQEAENALSAGEQAGERSLEELERKLEFYRSAFSSGERAASEAQSDINEARRQRDAAARRRREQEEEDRRRRDRNSGTGFGTGIGVGYGMGSSSSSFDSGGSSSGGGYSGGSDSF